MKKTLLMMLPILAVTLSTGCSEETQDKLSEAGSATTEAAKSAGDDVKDASAVVVDKAKEAGNEIQEMFKDQATTPPAVSDETDETIADVAGDLQGTTDAAASLTAQAQELLTKAKELVSEKNFADAQATLDQLKALPGYDALSAGIKDQVASLEKLIDQGQSLTGQLPGAMGK